MITFVAHWDEKIGPKLVDSLTIDEEIKDLDALIIQIFMTFQTMFGDSSDVDFHATYLTFPFKSYRHIGRIFLDTITNPDVRGGKEPFLIVVLCNDYIADDKITEFDSILNRISQDYKNSKENLSLALYRDDLITKLNQLLEMEALNIDVSTNYSLTQAVSDFQTGLQFFQKKKWKIAYDKIKKAILKFEQENQQKLQLEARYLISTILLKLTKFIGAYKSFTQLEHLAEQLNHQKYYETATFLQAFCLYKLNRYVETISKLETIPLNTSKFINKFQFYSILGQSYQYEEEFLKSIENQEKAFNILQQDPKMAENIKLKADILFNLGFSYYNHVLYIFKHKQNSEWNQEHYQSNLRLAITHLQSSAEYFNKINEHQQNIPIFQIIGNIHEFLGESELQLDYYYKAFDIAEKVKNFNQKLTILYRIVQMNEKSKNFEKNVELIKILRNELNHYTFLDSLTVAQVHFLLGRNLNQMNQQDKALFELLIALNYYRKLELLDINYQETLNLVLDIYRNLNDQDHIDYYQDELDSFSKKLQNYKPHTQSSMGVLKDIWVFTLDGLELFSYAPEMKFDPTLLGGFLSALRGFSEEISKKELNTLVMGEFRYNLVMEPDKNCFIMGRSLSRSPEKVAIDTLTHIYHQFVQKFSLILQNFTGDVSKFSVFKEILLKIDFSLI